MIVREAIEITEISDRNQLESLRPGWEDLLHRSTNATVFQTWEWVDACFRHFGSGKQPLVLCVHDGDRLIGLAPLEITHMYALPLRRVQFAGTGVSDYLDVILDADCRDVCLNAIFRWLGDNRQAWDLVDLQNLPEESPTTSWLRNEVSLESPSAIHPQCSAELIGGEMCPYLPLADTWENMLPRFGKKMRYNIGYYERLTRREFEDVAVSALGESELQEGMDAFFRLHTERWRKRFLPGMLADSGRQRFHRDVARLCLERGWLRLHGVRLNGKLQSILYCFAYKGKGYYYLGGFSPEYARYSLGTVLTGHAIKDAINLGCSEFDFLRGDEPYKFRWTGEHRKNQRLIIRKSDNRSRMASSICNLEQRIERRVKHELHKRIGAG